MGCSFLFGLAVGLAGKAGPDEVTGRGVAETRGQQMHLPLAGCSGPCSKGRLRSHVWGQRRSSGQGWGTQWQNPDPYATSDKGPASWWSWRGPATIGGHLVITGGGRRWDPRVTAALTLATCHPGGTVLHFLPGGAILVRVPRAGPGERGHQCAGRGFVGVWAWHLGLSPKGRGTCGGAAHPWGVRTGTHSHYSWSTASTCAHAPTGTRACAHTCAR